MKCQDVRLTRRYLRRIHWRLGVGSQSLIILWLLVCRAATAQEDTLWPGHQLLEFTLQDRKARVVIPKKPNPGRHWIWRVRFWGHQPQVDQYLLDKGFHLVWIDVSDLYGSSQAVEIGNHFYKHCVQKFQLDSKVVLEGFSRGGLMAYNWAAANPEKVVCIYADAPVMDIWSWPAGKGLSSGSKTDWQKCKVAYNLVNDVIDSMQLGPISHAEHLARFGIPIIHVCGKADEVVPYAENTSRFAQRYRTARGSIKIILKEGVGHHPHSLEDPRPITTFILQHTDLKLIDSSDRRLVSPTLIPRDGFYSQLGQSQDIYRIGFLGGSITHNGGWRDSIMKYFLDKYPHQNFEFHNAGIPSMGSTPGSFRLDKDLLTQGTFDLLFVEAAVNDAANGRSSKAQIRGMEGIVRHALATNPFTDILLMHFVDPEKLAHYHRGEIPRVISNHEKIAEHYQLPSLNLAKEVADRILNGEFSWEDDFIDLHPSPFGQGVYSRSIIKALEALFSHPMKGIRKLPEALDTFSYTEGTLGDISSALLGDGWTYVEKWSPRDSLATRKGFVNTPVLESHQPGSTITYPFEGKAIGILVAAGQDVGKLEYQIDEGPVKSIDQFTRWSHRLHLPWLYMLDDELTRGPHQLRLSISDDKNVDSKGYACRIFAFAVNH